MDQGNYDKSFTDPLMIKISWVFGDRQKKRRRERGDGECAVLVFRVVVVVVESSSVLSCPRVPV